MKRGGGAALRTCLLDKYRLDNALCPSVLKRDLLQRIPLRIVNRMIPGNTMKFFVSFDPSSFFLIFIWAPSGFSVVIQTARSLLISDVRVTST